MQEVKGKVSTCREIVAPSDHLMALRPYSKGHFLWCFVLKFWFSLRPSQGLRLQRPVGSDGNVYHDDDAERREDRDDGDYSRGWTFRLPGKHTTHGAGLTPRTRYEISQKLIKSRFENDLQADTSELQKAFGKFSRPLGMDGVDLLTSTSRNKRCRPPA